MSHTPAANEGGSAAGRCALVVTAGGRTADGADAATAPPDATASPTAARTNLKLCLFIFHTP
jgi:hypothetical protein